MRIQRGDVGHLTVGVLAFEFNYSFSPLFFSLSATDPLLDLEVGTAACVACGGGRGEIPSSSLVPEHTYSLQLLRDAFCLWMCVICFVSFSFFSKQQKV